MTDHLWSTPEQQPSPETGADWRPERPEAPRPGPSTAPSYFDRPQQPELPRVPGADATPTDEFVDVAAAAARVRGVADPQAPTEQRAQANPDAAPRLGPAAAVAAQSARAATPPPLPRDPSQEPTRVHQRDEPPVLGVAAAAQRVRERQQSVDSAPSGGSPYAARRRPAPDVHGEQPRRTWVAPFLSALVGALVVLVLFLVFFRNDDNGGSNSSAQAPLPATAGAGGSNANARTIYARAADSVVSIKAQMASGTATGTGFVISDKSTIVTNSHVVGTAKTVQVQFGQNTAPITATVLGRDVSTDLAVIRISPTSHTSLPLPLANSTDVRVGDGVVAIGNPFGLDRTATAGIVSAVGRHISAPNGFDIDDVIQTDAPINPGNSGGPLIDARGRVIGINSQIATASGGGGNVGIGFAVPANTIRKIVPQLEAGRTVTHAFLGVSTSSASSGAKVAQVTPSGPADTAGIRTGDTIVSVGGHKVASSDDLGAAVDQQKPGDDVQVEIIRGGVHQTIDVRLGNRPAGG